MAKKAEKEGATPRIGRLSNISEVAAEMARVYRDSRRNEIDPGVGAKLCFMLSALRQALEVGVLEERLAELEERLGQPQQQPARVLRIVR